MVLWKFFFGSNRVDFHMCIKLFVTINLCIIVFSGYREIIWNLLLHIFTPLPIIFNLGIIVFKDLGSSFWKPIGSTFSFIFCRFVLYSFTWGVRFHFWVSQDPSGSSPNHEHYIRYFWNKRHSFYGYVCVSVRLMDIPAVNSANNCAHFPKNNVRAMK